MSFFKKKIRLPIISVLFAVLFSLSTAAADSSVSLTVHFHKDSVKVSGFPFSVYKIAEKTDSTLTFTEDFAPLKTKVTGLSQIETADSEAMMNIAFTLKDFVSPFTPAASGKTDTKGELIFDNMSPGVYLFIGQDTTLGDKIYSAAPFIVITAKSGNRDILIEPKASVSDIPQKETVTVSAIKIWDDKGSESNRPKEITAVLLQNGEKFAEVKLSGENNWRCTWENLDADCEWSVTEKTVEGYSLTAAQSGSAYVLTNKIIIPKEPDPPVNPPILPQTGLLWWPVPILFLAGAVLLIAGLVCRRGVK